MGIIQTTNLGQEPIIYPAELEKPDDEKKIPKKTIADKIALDSYTELEFAEDCDKQKEVELFLKLPRTFLVDTAIGRYNPDFALVIKKNDERIL